ncbi:hypothetical protein LMG31886_43140 [Xanthomonas hydrangeae]|nr:hypothetical protein LMG31884_44230 [Xanthomonas hydrangeae]CAD7729986.1 hypothetical protein LMG31884_44230 [Xanthomonas hydrangeae]CAD7732035.1 hypothetical protein LMG31885_17250 [Xanthomonas hydrangeae]CAD7732038.1 hypothetical protein LMG31885_17250 [Xanthomonas hydrangeae]CAD7745247.1 hypothetical protein LMG31887_44150 [Xanthomonas hydrangeae]
MRLGVLLTDNALVECFTGRLACLSENQGSAGIGLAVRQQIFPDP